MLFANVAYAMGQASGGAQGQGNPIAAFAPLIIMFAIFYFLLIRPQQKKAKQHKELLNDLKRGDYILTSGGLYGRITAVSGDILTIDLGNDVEVKVGRSFIAGLAENPGKTKADKKNKTEKKEESNESGKN